MSQDEIIKVLQKKKEPLTSKELADYLQIRQETIIKSLTKLIEHKEVKARKPTKEEIDKKGWNKCNMNSRWRVFLIKK